MTEYDYAFKSRLEKEINKKIIIVDVSAEPDTFLEWEKSFDKLMDLKDTIHILNWSTFNDNDFDNTSRFNEIMLYDRSFAILDGQADCFIPLNPNTLVNPLADDNGYKFGDILNGSLATVFFDFCDKDKWYLVSCSFTILAVFNGPDFQVVVFNMRNLQRKLLIIIKPRHACAHGHPG